MLTQAILLWGSCCIRCLAVSINFNNECIYAPLKSYTLESKPLSSEQFVWVAALLSSLLWWGVWSCVVVWGCSSIWNWNVGAFCGQRRAFSRVYIWNLFIFKTMCSL
jgi:hypothetical protein